VEGEMSGMHIYAFFVSAALLLKKQAPHEKI
jgi:hypothetical protein